MNDYSNLEDYLLWRGDLTFEEYPLNLIDHLILCELSYIDYSAIGLNRTSCGTRTLQDAGAEILDKGVYALKNLFGGEQRFFELACASRRFGSLKIRNYTDIFDELFQVQFSALTFDLDDQTSYVAFRGTDDSLTGWKEDFMISFTRIPSQELSVQYLEKVMQEDRRYYVAGHSKGGNLAVYAAAHQKKEIQDKIIRIYDLDGPGFSDDVLEMGQLESLKDRVTKIVPEFCLIGRIFETKFDDTIIVKSSGRATQQHDMITWKLYGPELMCTDHTDANADRISEVLMKWADTMTLDERRAFINEIFDALQQGGIQHFSEISAKSVIKTLQAMSATSDTAKGMVKDLARLALGMKPDKKSES